MTTVSVWTLSACLWLGGYGAVDEQEKIPEIRTLWDYQKPGETRKRFQGLLDELDREKHRDLRLEVQTQIGRTWGLEGGFGKAHDILDEVKKRLEGAGPRVRVRYLLERGRVFNSSGKAGDARPLFLEAWDLARESEDHGLAVDAAHMVGIVEKGEKSLEWNQRAIDYAEKTGEPRALDWLGSLYNNTGWSYHEMGKFEEALGLWQKALLWQKERSPGTDRERVARYMVGRGLRSLKRFQEALEIQQNLLAEIEGLELESDGYVHEEVAECLLALGKEEEARGQFGLAYDQLSKDDWLVEHEPDRLARLKRMAGRD